MKKFLKLLSLYIYFFFFNMTVTDELEFTDHCTMGKFMGSEGSNFKPNSRSFGIF